jgi:hypothetical protein
VTGKAEVGGFQFDVFPGRKLDGHFESQEIRLDSLETPEELSLGSNGTTIYLCL